MPTPGIVDPLPTPVTEPAPAPASTPMPEAQAEPLEAAPEPAPIPEAAAAQVAAVAAAQAASPAAAPTDAPARAQAPAPGYAPAAPLPAPRQGGKPAVVVEAICGIVGLFGIGWLMSGIGATGLLLLVGGIIWDVVGFFFGISTSGLAFAVVVAVNIVVLIISSALLNRRLTTGR